MSDPGLFVLLLVAIGCGWVLGRHQVRRRRQEPLIKGLNYLISEQPDKAIEDFINAQQVNAETFELHIALGSMLRKKGEVDRAIRIHQNLLSRQSLRDDQLQQAHLELARDYMSAGWLDRAERLLVELVENSGPLRGESLRLLINLYQREKDWEKAIELTRRMMPRSLLPRRESTLEPQQRLALAHFYCELAEKRLHDSEYRQAHSVLRSALQADKSCCRAWLLLAELDLRQGHPVPAIKALQRVRELDPELLVQVLPLLHRCFAVLEDGDGEMAFLEDLLARSESTAVVLAISERLRCTQGEAAALDFVSQRVRRRPTLQGLRALLDCHLSPAADRGGENLALLSQVLGGLAQGKARFQCTACGFRGELHHWLCPSCQQWATVRLIRGIEGD